MKNRDLSLKIKLLLLQIFCCNTLVFSQDSLVNHTIDSTLVSAERQQNLQIIPTSTAGDVLKASPGVFLRTQSVGGIQLVSVQGLNPQHVQILWNGIPVNSGMMGLSDLSLFSVGYQQQIKYNASGQDKATGAVGGVVQLQSEFNINNAIHTRLQQSMGSFGQVQTSFEQKGNLKKQHWQINFQGERAQNNFPYEDYTVIPKQNYRQDWAKFKRFYIYPRWQMQVNEHLSIRLFNEWVFSERNIPASLVSPEAKGQQTDQVNRALAQVVFNRNKVMHEWNISSIYNYWYFNDVLLQRDDTNREISSYFRYKGHWDFAEKWKIFYGNDVRFTKVKSENYSKGQQEWAWDAHTGLHFQATSRWKFSGLVKLSTRSALPWYVPATLEASYWAGKRKMTKIHWRGSFDARYPTLNDRFWSPGGNENLEAEKSKSTTLSTQSSLIQNSKFSWKISNEVFLHRLSNMIMWLPTNKFYWVPQNIGEVRAYGYSAEQQFNFQGKNMNAQLLLSYQYTSSASVKPVVPNDKTVGKQLPYFPQHMGKWNFTFRWKDLSIQTDGQAYGKRFITRDEGSFISAFSLLNAGLAYQWQFKTFGIEGRFNINNVLNEAYEEIKYRPMPRRNFLFTIILNWKHENI